MAEAKKVALDGAREQLTAWMRAERAAAVARKEADRLKSEFRETMSTLGAEEGTFNGVKVLTYRTKDTFQGKAFAEARPDLVEQFTVTVETQKLDLAALRAAHPDLVAKYLSTELRPNWGALETALAIGESGK
jgi:hypothetical protein